MAAEIMLGASLESALSDLSPSKQRKVTKALLDSGMVDAETQTFVPDVFRKVLESTHVPTRQGRERFVEGKRILQYPANLEERGELLAWVAGEVFTADEILTEREINDRLRPYSEDVAVLRRYLVDYELVERRSDGSEYALTGRGAKSVQG
ncbi:MAG: DUF2087 domain-containing protein [Micrococcaceae bacterium]